MLAFTNSAVVAAVVSALIAAFAAWWSKRTSPYGRLETLTSLYKNWPTDDDGRLIDGRDVVADAIAARLKRVDQINRRKASKPWIIGKFGAVAALVIAIVTWFVFVIVST